MTSAQVLRAALQHTPAGRRLSQGNGHALALGLASRSHASTSASLYPSSTAPISASGQHPYMLDRYTRHRGSIAIARPAPPSRRLLSTLTLTLSSSSNNEHIVGGGGGERAYSTGSSTSAPTSEGSPVVQQLRDVQALRARLMSVNSPTDKMVVIMGYPQLHELMETIYQPHFKTWTTYAGVKSYMAKKAETPDSQVGKYDSILDLLHDLSTGQYRGDQPKELVRSFVIRHNLQTETDLMDTLGTVLDKNLKMGFGANTLSKVPWKDTAGSSAGARGNDTPAGPGAALEGASAAAKKTARVDAGSTPPRGSASTSASASTSTSASAGTPTPRPPINLKGFSCALGKSIEGHIANSLKPGTKWYASRKLDGLRCLTLVDFHVPSSPGQPPTFHNLAFVSRNGKAFTSLDKLVPQIERLAQFPKLREWIDRDPFIVQGDEAAAPKGDGDGDGDGVIKRLVLDGECCVMVPINYAGSVGLPSTRQRSTGLAGSGESAASALWKNEGLIEDFTSAVSSFRRQNITVPHPSYYLFDLLSGGEVDAQGPLRSPGLGKSFGERKDELAELVDWLDAELQRGGVEERMIKRLEQIPVEGGTGGKAEEMVDRASSEGWEGLIFRADKPYKGKRSTDILKFKKWQDAEYVVTSVESDTMRLPVDGVFEDRKAMARVWIEHKGTPVAIGSGFTVDERLRFAQDPSSIIGKQITVQYFSESESSSKPGQKSLRFPRVKKVWEDGPRDV